ncbi:MAG: PEP/pyruvate-binding domain-containing protein [Calditrichia bacterium]
MKNKSRQNGNTHRFNRRFFDPARGYSLIGNGELGGKASGLAGIQEFLEREIDGSDFPGISVSIPAMTVLTTAVFDNFMAQNNLYDAALSETDDRQIALAFQNGDLPANIVGDLWALISEVKTPLAIRSSSLMEDSLFQPLAGIFETKMIPNNQFEPQTRFRKLVEAVKLVYASTFFQNAKQYFSAIRQDLAQEKMAVIIQEVVGNRYGGRFYPVISGVARSYNFYPAGQARPEEGVVLLALGLGKTIVDEGMGWSYSPEFPHLQPPFNSAQDLLKNTQTRFWAVNMEKMHYFDPINEAEYLLREDLKTAEQDRVLKYISSTYDPSADRLYPGVFGNGPRALTFAPLLQMEQFPLNSLLKKLLWVSEKALGTHVEIEFAVKVSDEDPKLLKLGFLQVRPMVVSGETVQVSPQEMDSPSALLASRQVLGNGMNDQIRDVVYVKPDVFDPAHSAEIAKEIETLNSRLVAEEKPYLLMGFGRWGSRDPWLGIPVNWGQIAGAKVIVESTLPEMNVDLSQGSHFFHNITSFRVSYFSVRHSGPFRIDWEWLEHQEVAAEKEFVKHVVLAAPLTVKVDGRESKGVILK